MQVQKELRNAGSSLGESKRAFPRGGQRAAAKGQVWMERPGMHAGSPGRASQEFRSDAEEEPRRPQGMPRERSEVCWIPNLIAWTPRRNSYEFIGIPMINKNSNEFLGANLPERRAREALQRLPKPPPQPLIRVVPSEGFENPENLDLIKILLRFYLDCTWMLLLSLEF